MDPRIARIQDRQKAQTAATRLAVTPIVAASDAATEATVVALFDAFGVGKAYRVGDVCSHGGKVYRCVQAHRSQADWTPGVAPQPRRPARPRGLLPGDLVRRGHRRRDGAVVLQPGIGAVGPRIGSTGRAMMSAVTPARGIRETRTG